MKKLLILVIGAVEVAFLPRVSNLRAETLTVTKDMTLEANAVYDAVEVVANATLDLGGHVLTTGALSGDGTIMSATQDGAAMAGGCTMLDFVETPSANSEVFVDTRYTPLCTDRVETKVEFGTISGNEIVFSSRQNDTDDVNSKHLTCFRISAKLRFDRYNKYGHATSGTLATKTPYEIVADFGNLRYTVNDEGPFATTSGVGDFTAYTNILLFATGKLNDSTYKLSSFANSCRMYYFRVYDSAGDLKVNMVPASRNGVVGFYDTVRKVFLAPANGALLAYAPLEYVRSPENNGAAHAYVNTGYTPLLTDRVETKIRPSDVSNYPGVFAARTTSTTNTFSCFLIPENGKFKLRFDHHTTSPYVYHQTGSSDTVFETGKDYEIVMDGNTLGFSVNGVESTCSLTANPEDETATIGLTLRLFALGTKGSGHSNYANGCRMYYFRVYDKSGDLKLDLVPKRRLPDGAVGFYNRLNGNFILQDSQESVSPTDLTPGPVPPTDLTSPEGRCWSSEKDTDRGTTVTNLFNNNFVNGTSATSRFILMNIGDRKPAIDYDFGEGSAQVINMYRIYGGGSGRPPVAWEIWGSDSAFGSSDETGWTLLDSRSGEPNWAQWECRTKAFANNTPYRYYRFRMKEKGSDAHFELTQIEYFHIGNTSFPGKIHIDVEPTDLTSPEGRCWSSVQDTTYRSTTVTNLFNNNYVNGDTATTRFIVVNIGNAKPAIDYDFGEGNAQAVNMYRIYGGAENRTPVAWEIWGSDTSFGSADETGWSLLDSRSGEPDWARSECRTKVFVNETAYRYYRFKVKQNGSAAHFEMTQIEYFHVENTSFPGKIHADRVVTNATVAFGGNMKVVKDGPGTFLSSMSNQFYTGGTDVLSGEFIVGTPLVTALTMSDGTTLGFYFANKGAVPLLTLESGSSVPSSLDVSVYRAAPFSLPREGATVTTGYDFNGTTVNFVNPSPGLFRVRKDVSGNLVVDGQLGMVLILR
ncbi:MAG: hypothetical protein J6336_07280 [Kiritimatiellae bacterium]|nr:hypothetical protein [Kiritimatiellia bacterium]